MDAGGAASVGVDWLQAVWTCSAGAGGGEGTDEGVAPSGAISSAASSFLGDGALDPQAKGKFLAMSTSVMRIEGDTGFA